MAEQDDVEDVRKSFGRLEVRPTKPLAPLRTLDVQGIAYAIKEGQFKNIVVLTGAGISVSAGIPDFRTPGTGLYDNLQKYNLPAPEAIFDIDYFRQRPQAFCTLAKEMFPGKFAPTPAHRFIQLLERKGVLLRNYTQNVDGLEFEAGVSADKVVQAHGGFSSAHCIECKAEYPPQFVADAVNADKIPRCNKPGCSAVGLEVPSEGGGLVKPDIVFFGEALPARMSQCMQHDMPRCDLLIVMGSSLRVQPVASLIDRVPKTAARLLINREVAGVYGSDDDELGFMAMLMGYHHGGFRFGKPDNNRDVFLQMDCDAGVRELATAIGWGTELEDLVRSGPRPPVDAAAAAAEGAAASAAAVAAAIAKEKL